jgi:hypothetical protein
MIKNSKKLVRGDLIRQHGRNYIVTVPNAVGGAGFKAITDWRLSESLFRYDEVKEVDYIMNVFEIK